MKGTLPYNKYKGYVKIEFNGGESVEGGETICFDTMEIRDDINISKRCIPQIFQSSGGYATAISRHEPTKISVNIKNETSDTLYKLNRISSICCGPYKARLILSRYFTCVRPFESSCNSVTTTSPTGDDWTTGGVIVGEVDAGPAIRDFDLIGIGSEEDLDLSGPIVPTGGFVEVDPIIITTPVRDEIDIPTTGGGGVVTPPVDIVPGPGDVLVVNGAIIEYNEDVFASITAKGLIWLPYSISVVIEYSGGWHNLSRGIGVNAGHVAPFIFWETKDLEVPLPALIVPDLESEFGGVGEIEGG